MEGNSEVVVGTHDTIKRRLVEVRYIFKFERNLILLGRLEA